jgi:hypothetical protein
MKTDKEKLLQRRAYLRTQLRKLLEKNELAKTFEIDKKIKEVEEKILNTNNKK